MGKKRVVQKGDSASNLRLSNVKETSSKKKVSRGIAYIQSTYHNTLVSLADLSGNTLAWSSSGSLGFKGAKKGTPFAAQTAADSAARRAMDQGMRQMRQSGSIWPKSMA
jgi:small subunit ribosomal protein S11